ncbi:MAG: hypothetical protein ABXS91_09980 [Sulfurimonas sp.]
MKTKVISAPTELPVTLDEAKAFYRVIGADEDADIVRSISAATEKAEQITNRQLKMATYEGYLDAFVSSVKLPKPPFAAMTKVEYIDTDGETQSWTDYCIDDVVEPAVMYFDSFPPDVKTEGVNNVIATFTSGYENVPEAIKSWILIYGLTLFENRENLVEGVSVSDVKSEYYSHLLDSFRIIPI